MTLVAKQLLTNRIAPHFGGRLVDIAERPQADVEISPELQTAFQALVPQLRPPERVETLRGFWSSSQAVKKATKTDFFRELPGKITEVTTFLNTIFAWLPEIVKANLEFRQVSARQELVRDVADSLLANARLPKLLPAPEIPLTDIAVRTDVTEIHEELNKSLRTAVFQGLKQFFGALRRLAESEVVGGIHWASPDVCEFWFYRFTVQEQILGIKDLGQEVKNQALSGGGRVETTLRHREREILQTLKHSVHVHKVLNAQVLPITANLEMPDRVRDFLKTTPPVLTSSVQIITGDEYHRRVIERDLKNQKRTEKFSETVKEVVFRPRDPVVVLNDFALTGWSPEEK